MVRVRGLLELKRGLEERFDPVMAPVNEPEVASTQ